MRTVRVLEIFGLVLLVLGILSAAIRQCMWPERAEILHVTAAALTLISGKYDIKTVLISYLPVAFYIIRTCTGW